MKFGVAPHNNNPHGLGKLKKATRSERVHDINVGGRKKGREPTLLAPRGVVTHTTLLGNHRYGFLTG